MVFFVNTQSMMNDPAECAALAAALPRAVRARALAGYVGRGGQAARSADAVRAVAKFYNDRCGVAVVQVLNSLVGQGTNDDHRAPPGHRGSAAGGADASESGGDGLESRWAPDAQGAPAPVPASSAW